MSKTTKKRPREVIILGWLVLSFATYIFYKTILILGEYVMLPFSFIEILTKGSLDFRINLITMLMSHIFSILLIIAAIGVLYLKRWAFILLVSIFILDFLKKFYVMAMLSIKFNLLFAVEIILLFLAVSCFYHLKTRFNTKSPVL